MLPGSGIFTSAVKCGVVPHTRKQFWQQFQNYAPPSLRVIRTKFALIASTIIGERAKRARHSQVCSIENRGYIYILYYIMVRAKFVLITRKEGGA